MVKAAGQNEILWMSPSPIWGERSRWMRLPAQQQPTRPIILRFANDMFMDELMAMLTHSPWRLDEWIAQNETWRDPKPNPGPVEISRPGIYPPDTYNKTRRLVQNFSVNDRLIRIKNNVKAPAADGQAAKEEAVKLYQANHQRYYVVTASLVSQEEGYPDYLPNHGSAERASFVVRALVEKEDHTCDEYGFVTTASGKAWRRVGAHGIEGAAVQRALPNEEKLPLFPLTYPDGCGRLRRLFGGLIPVGRRDEWIDAPAFDPGAAADIEFASPVATHDGGVDHFKEILYSDVIGPWKALIDRTEADKLKNGVAENSFPNFEFNPARALADKLGNIRTARDEIQTSCWYILHDFARYLRDHLPEVWKKIKASVDSGDADRMALSDQEAKLVEVLLDTKMDMRLFLDLAIENLAVGGFVSEDRVSLWERLVDFWTLEIYLKLSALLYELGDPSDLFMAKVRSEARLSAAFRQNCLQFIEHFQKSPFRTFHDFARQVGEKYPILKSAAVKSSVPSHANEEYFLAGILQKIELPVIQSRVKQALGKDLSGAADIKKSLWELLSFYWIFEAHVDDKVASDVSAVTGAYLHSGRKLAEGDLNERILEWFYEDDQSGRWYSFVQFADDLARYSPALHTAALFDVFAKILNADAQTQKLIDVLDQTEITQDLHKVLGSANPDGRRIRILPTLAGALVEALNASDVLEGVDTPYDRSLLADPDILHREPWWPDFLFMLTDSEPVLTMDERHVVPRLYKDAAPETDVDLLKSHLDRLAEMIDDLVRGKKGLSGDRRSAMLGISPLLKERSPRFVVRFVFERPRCGNLFAPVVSPATTRLELAPFMDPDAPARAVRIHMPLDITPAGLRKYKKNASFLFSDMMCGKIKKIRKLTLGDLVLSILPWPFHKDLPDVGNTGPCRSDGETLGLICSLSIPIVTLCAMILVFIMVNLFNIFFKWMPWFFVCFPLPGLSGLKAKDEK